MTFVRRIRMSKFFNKKIASAGQQSGKNNKSSILFYGLALLAAFKGIQWLVEVIPKIIEWISLRM